MNKKSSITKQQALENLLRGEVLSKTFYGEKQFEVLISVLEHCNFSGYKQKGHKEIGPIHVKFWTFVYPNCIHISWEQLYNYLDRNYL